MKPRTSGRRIAEASFARRRHRARWPRRGGRDLRRIVLLSVVLFMLLVGIVAPAATAVAIGPLPSVAGLSSNALPQDLLIYDRHGALLADIGNQGNHRIAVPLAAISSSMVDATIALEDRTFYKNAGVDFMAMGRALVTDIIQRQFVEGGSTITQQLVKQLFFGPNPPQTLQRKLREAAIAVVLTRQYSKNQILELYLNTIYYGNQAYGVEAAARTYFHASAAHLTLAQASLLAGIPRAPTAYDPVLHLQAAQRRQAEVLAAMVRQADITQAQATAAAVTPVQVFPATATIAAPHFVDYVLAALQQLYRIAPGDRRGYRVTTSLDLTLQHTAEAAVQAQVARQGNYYNFHDASLVTMDPKTGEILAMVGSANYNTPGGKINLATSPSRQVGSAFKIFTYTAAIESRKLNTVSPILDAPLTFPIGGPGNGPYTPTNYDQSWHGTVPLKMALGNSLNIPALKVELYTGIPAVLDAARRMGVTTLTQADSYYGPSLTLGAYPVSVLDMAVGASTLADLGVRHSAAPIVSITDAAGKAVFTYDPLKTATQVVAPETAYIMASILSDDQNRCLEFGCNGDLTLPGRQVAAKTGTSEGFRDNWTLGFTPDLTTVAWVGNADNTPLSHNSTGIVGAAPIWHQFMVNALRGSPNTWYARPSGLDQIGDNWFLPGTEFLPEALAGSWPTCPSRNYPTTTTWSQIQVNGLPCVIDQFGTPFDLFGQTPG